MSASPVINSGANSTAHASGSSHCGSHRQTGDLSVRFWAFSPAPRLHDHQEAARTALHRLPIERLAVDTHMFTHFTMAQAKLLGFDLCPRLADLADRKLDEPRDFAVPAELEAIARPKVSPSCAGARTSTNATWSTSPASTSGFSCVPRSAAAPRGMTSIAGKIGCTAGTLHRWCLEKASPKRSWLTVPAALAADDRARLKLLEREVKELRRVNKILREPSAYFAQAELDRRER
jgi:transposase-like protein